MLLRSEREKVPSLSRVRLFDPIDGSPPGFSVHGILQARTLEWVAISSSHACLKLNIQKTKITAPGPITSCHIDGETMEKVTDFIILGSKITADGDCSHEIKRCLLLGRKAMTNLDSKFKSRDFASKDPYSQSYDISNSHVHVCPAVTRAPPPAFPRNPRGRLGFPGPTQGEG